MDNFFAEGEQTSKRIRLNQSEILAYGTRKPTGSPVISKSKHRDRGRGSSGDSAYNFQSAQMLMILQELSQQTNSIANEIMKMKTWNQPPNSFQGAAPGNDFLYLIWQELAYIRRDLDILSHNFTSLHLHGREARLHPAPELLRRATRSIEQLERKLASMPGASLPLTHYSSSYHKATQNYDHAKQHHSKPEPNYYQSTSSAFTEYRTPLPLASCTPVFNFDSYYKAPNVQLLKHPFKDVKISGYTPDPSFSTRTPRVFGKRKGLETGIDDSLACYRAEMNARAIRKQKKNHGPSPMEIE